MSKPRLMQANTTGELHDHVHYERASCKSKPACVPVNDPEIAKQESDAARRERGYLDSEKATETAEMTAHEMPERDDGHIQVVHKNCPRSQCPICEGGLFMCSRCGGGEGSVTTECPGEKMTWRQFNAVYAGRLDFRGGKWVDECSPHAPIATVPRLDMTGMRCQEASQFSTTRYLACSQPATKLVLSERGRRLYPMCDMCADHNIRNRGAKLAAVHEAMNV